MARIIKKIDIQKYKKNLEAYKKELKGNTQIMAVVKANAYGHGLEAIARAGTEVGVNRFAVATAIEAEELRGLNLNRPIQLLSEKHPDQLKSGDIWTLFSQSQLKYLENIKENIKVHIKVETGLGRLGFFPEEVEAVVKTLKNYKHIMFEGILTHMAKSFDKHAIEAQYQKIEVLQKQYHVMYHISNSEMAQKFPECHLDCIRLGLLSYRDVMTIETEILSIKRFKKGHSFSYESLFTTPKDTTVAVLGIGYADGIPMRMHQGGYVYIKGANYPVIGRPCMDMIMVDLGENKDAISVEDKAEIKVSELAKVLAENEWNLLCGFDRRRVETHITKPK